MGTPAALDRTVPHRKRNSATLPRSAGRSGVTLSLPMHPLMLSLIASAGLGAMIGLIRQWNEQEDKAGNADFAGLRTFTLWSLLGCGAAFISDEYSPAVLPVIFAVVGAHSILGRKMAKNDAPGSTTFVASLLTVLVGALVFWKQHQEAIVLTALMVVLIGFKDPIHAWTRAFTEQDIRATLQFVAITGVILPLVPDQAYGPFDGFNPHSVWMMVVLISGVGFAGYVLMRLLDARAGIVLTSLLGGIASSTATTLAFSRRSREDPAHSESYAMAVAIACTVMLARMLAILALINRPLTLQLLMPFGLMAVPGVACAAFFWWRQNGKRKSGNQPVIGNPLSLMTAVKFALIYAVISFLVKAAEHSGHLQDGLLPLSFVSGLTDLDAIALSIADSLNAEELGTGLAVKAIILAAIANSALKAGLTVAFGSPALWRRVVILMAGTIACGTAGFVLVGGEDAAPTGEAIAPNP